MSPESKPKWKQTAWNLTKKALVTLPVLWLVVTVVFLLIHIVPGDPIAQMLGEGASATDLSALRHAYGFDAPLGTQYARYWRGVAHGDLGQSLRLHDSVLHLVLQRYPYTLALAVAALLIGGAMALPAGIVSAQKRNGWQDKSLGLVSLVGLSFPNFALGPILIIVFSIGLGWLPVSGAGSGILDFLRHLVLPAVTLGLGLAAILTRMVRTSMLEELGQDYIRTARAKGLSPARIVFRHALRNALAPVLTAAGVSFGYLLSGSFVVETIFTVPGVGYQSLHSLSTRDYSFIQATTLLLATIFVVVNLLVDLAASALDPRVREASV